MLSKMYILLASSRLGIQDHYQELKSLAKTRHRKMMCAKTQENHNEIIYSDEANYVSKFQVVTKAYLNTRN